MKTKTTGILALGLMLLASAPGRPAPGASVGSEPTSGEQDAGELDEFVPTERISADKSISFPVDI